jgi:hypothetical protein
MRWRLIMRWTPAALFVALFGAGAALLAVDVGASGAVLIIGAASGSQIGIVMTLAGTAAAIVALFQAAVLSTRLRRRPLRVAGHSVVVQTTIWHHVSRTILEGEGLLFRPVVACRALPVEGYDPFTNGEYDMVARGGRDVLRFAQRPGGPFTGEAVLGLRPGEDAAAFCASTSSPRAGAE